MDQNQTVDNDLQKAIDDITNATNTDPVFTDPVAAPASASDNNELNNQTNSLTESNVEMITPAPEPIAPLESADVPELNNLSMPESMPMPPAESKVEPTPAIKSTPEPSIEPATTLTVEQPSIVSTPIIKKTDTTPTITSPSIEEPHAEKLNVEQIKTAALHDLIPLLDKINIDALQKFNIYRDIFEDLKDYTVLEPAYKAAREIPSETERAEALLYLVESIDKI